MKIPRKSRRFLELTAALDAEFVRLGRPAIEGQSADYLAKTVEEVARQLGVEPAHALSRYISDDWPIQVATKIVAELEEHDGVTGETEPVELTSADALRVATSLGVAADWTLRIWAKTLLEARHAMVATGPLHSLTHAILTGGGEPIAFGGRDLADARLAFVATIPKMRELTDCDCTDHERAAGKPCSTMLDVADTLLDCLHVIGGVMPSPDQKQRRHPMDDLFGDFGPD